jgi:hypothetical protein
MEQLQLELWNENDFKSFVSRMWLDHCDENKAPLCITYTLEEYVLQYHDWLKKQYVLKNGIV